VWVESTTCIRSSQCFVIRSQLEDSENGANRSDLQNVESTLFGNGGILLLSAEAPKSGVIGQVKTLKFLSRSLS
jgi:hypothetical protein